MRSFAQGNEFPVCEPTETAQVGNVGRMSGLSQTVDFHPELARAARFMPRSPITPWNLRFIRKVSGLLERRVPEGTEVLTLSSGVGIRLHRPTTGADRGGALLWIHGGGYLIGSPAQDDVLCRRFADELGITVGAVKYRLAPDPGGAGGLLHGAALAGRPAGRRSGASGDRRLERRRRHERGTGPAGA